MVRLYILSFVSFGFLISPSDLQDWTAAIVFLAAGIGAIVDTFRRLFKRKR